MLTLDFTFPAELWQWKGGSWHFATLPTSVSEDIKAFAGGSRRGFGSVKVSARIGDTRWNTSVFPSKEHGAFLLPVKAAVRKAEGLEVGGGFEVELIVDPEL